MATKSKLKNVGHKTAAIGDESKPPSADQLRLQMGELTAAEVRIAQAAWRLGHATALTAQRRAERVAMIGFKETGND